MIRVDYHMRRHELRAIGHAQYAEPGKDIICAAVTALMLTAGEFAEHNGDATVKTDPGDLYVRCVCSPKWDGVVTLVMNAIAAGLYKIAQEHPDYVKFERYA